MSTTRLSLVLAILLAAAASLAFAQTQCTKNALSGVYGFAGISQSDTDFISLPGHIPPGLKHAVLIPSKPDAANAPVILTVLLRPSREKELLSFGRAVNDPRSPQFHKFATREEMADRFAPSKAHFEAVRTYLEKNHFQILHNSRSRLLLTVRGTRGDVSRAFHVELADYQITETKPSAVGSGPQATQRTCRGPKNEPSLPRSLVGFVSAVAGLSNCATMRTMQNPHATPLMPTNSTSLAQAYDAFPTAAFGSGQTIGIYTLSDYYDTDIESWLAYANIPSWVFNQIERVQVLPTTPATVDGPSGGNSETEILQDITTALGMAPGAWIRVYEYPLSQLGDTGASVAAAMMTAIDEMLFDEANVDVISTSFIVNGESYLGQAEINSYGPIFNYATGIGVSIFAPSGDGGYSGDIPFPSDEEFVTSVGGTSLTALPEGIFNPVGSYAPYNLYGHETWWDLVTPHQGQGGYGNSTVVPTPWYQNGYNTSPWRSIPDVSADADAYVEVIYCQSDFSSAPGGCGLGANGTSMSTPTWAGATAVINEVCGNDAGLIQGWAPHPGSQPGAQPGLHAPGTMQGTGNDFTHVGFGSPDIANLAANIGGYLYCSGGITPTTPGQVTLRTLWRSCGQVWLYATPINSSGLPVASQPLTLQGSAGLVFTQGETTSAGTLATESNPLGKAYPGTALVQITSAAGSNTTSGNVQAWVPAWGGSATNQASVISVDLDTPPQGSGFDCQQVSQGTGSGSGMNGVSIYTYCDGHCFFGVACGPLCGSWQTIWVPPPPLGDPADSGFRLIIPAPDEAGSQLLAEGVTVTMRSGAESQAIQSGAAIAQLSVGDTAAISKAFFASRIVDIQATPAAEEQMQRLFSAAKQNIVELRIPYGVMSTGAGTRLKVVRFNNSTQRWTEIGVQTTRAEKGLVTARLPGAGRYTVIQETTSLR